MLTKGAIGNLVNRYKAVLKKCHLINVFGSLAVASMLVLGSAGMAAGETYEVEFKDKNEPTTSLHANKSLTDEPISWVNLTITGGTYHRVGAVTASKTKVCYNTLLVQGGKYVHKYDSEGRVSAVAIAYSALSKNGEINNNTTIIEKISVYDAYGALADNSSSQYNKLEIRETAQNIDSAIGAAHNNDGDAKFNSAIFTGGKNSKVENLLGARMNGTGNAIGNSATMNSGNATFIAGGKARKNAGYANENIVNMNGGQAVNIYGGLAKNPQKGEANKNKVFINGGTVSTYIVGGAGKIKATANEVTISGKPTIKDAKIYGGAFFKDDNALDISDSVSPTSDFRTGNTLNIKTSGLTAKNIYNFDTINFTVASKVHPGDKPLLELKGGGETDLTDVAVGVTVEPRTDVLKKGDRIHLLRNDSNLVGEAKGEVASIPYGNFVTYDFALDQTQTTLDLEVVNASTTPQAKSLSEGRTAMLAFVNQGAELIAERGMEAARQEALEGSLTPFLAGQGGKSRYDTGSHVDVTGFYLIAGLTSARKTEIGTATMAAFFESSWADYDAHNSFASAASVNADGNTRYYGGGLLAHMAFPDFGPGHAYAETSLRTGWAETDYHSGDLRDSFGNTAAYDSGSAYYGAHFGLGYEWKLSDVSALDFYAKYFWTHQEGDHVRVMNDPIHFESADSHRSRFGVRYEHEFKTDGMVVKPFIGAAYEYEYDGDVAGTAYGFTMDKPSLRGGTGAGELGVTLKSSENSAFSLNLSVQGYTGTREGVSGSFLLNYRF